MARYIDADALIEVLQTDFDREGAKAYEYAMQEGMTDISIKYSHGQFCFLNAIERVKDTPTADVVPKSEVERWRNECENQSILWRSHFESVFQTAKEAIKQEVAREIFEEIEEVLNELGYFDEIDFKALKKKHTESEDKG